jgi:cytochrome c biogenesis protein CcmG/thiol:disulfide interchange protein DsbE
MRRIWPFVIVLAVAALFLWGLRRPNPNELPSVLINKPAPNFVLPTLETYRDEWGQQVELSQHIGKPIVLNLWASWCVPCRTEAPLLESYWRQYKGRVLFLGVNVQDTNKQAALNFVRDYGLTFPSGFDAAGRVWIDYGGYGVPETFVIDRAGKVLVRHAGPVSEGDVERYLKMVGQ